MKDKKLIAVLPVLFGFYVMGFCDVVGISTSYAKESFNLSESAAGFFPSMVFIWFFLLSVPVAILMNKTGRKKMVQISNIITFVGMLIPFIKFTLPTCVLAFVLLGIGNTILQVALNPLLTNVVKGNSLSSMLTTGQLFKAISSFCGPFIAALAVSAFGNWRFLFPIFAAITLVSYLWLLFTPIKEDASENAEPASLKSVFGLFKDNVILMLFLGIFCIVGIDVGTNTVAPKLLIERCALGVEKAALASSVYFICRTAGTFLGSFLLSKMDDIKYFIINMVLASLTLISMFFVKDMVSILVMVGFVGFFCSSIFSVIFSAAMKARPDKANEISGLMIMGVCGGAVIPPVMGLLCDLVGNQNGSIAAIFACAAYLMFCSLWLRGREKKASGK